MNSVRHSSQVSLRSGPLTPSVAGGRQNSCRAGLAISDIDNFLFPRPLEGTQITKATRCNIRTCRAVQGGGRPSVAQDLRGQSRNSRLPCPAPVGFARTGLGSRSEWLLTLPKGSFAQSGPKGRSSTLGLLGFPWVRFALPFVCRRGGGSRPARPRDDRLSNPG